MSPVRRRTKEAPRSGGRHTAVALGPPAARPRPWPVPRRRRVAAAAGPGPSAQTPCPSWSPPSLCAQVHGESESWKRRCHCPLSQVGNDTLIRFLFQAVPPPPRPLPASHGRRLPAPGCHVQPAPPSGATHCLVGLAASSWGLPLGRVAASWCLEGEPRFRGSGVLGSGTGAGGRSFI